MDMSRFVQNWKVGDRDAHVGLPPYHASLTCPSDKPVTMEIQVAGAEPPERGKVCIVQGVSEDEELWAIRMDHTGRLFLHLGTAGRRETEYAHFPGFVMALSYNPTSGNISLSVRDSPQGAGGAELLGGGARNQWVAHVARHDRPPRESWQFCLGCPLDGRADKPPLGWTISASFRFGNDLRGVIVPPAPRPFEVLHLISRDRLYTLAAEGADHTELSAEWHQGVLAGARAMGWKGGAA